MTLCKVNTFRFPTGAKVSNTIRKGIISVDAYGNGTETDFMLGNTAALSGKGRSFEPRCEKTGLLGFRPGLTQTRLFSHRRWLEA